MEKFNLTLSKQLKQRLIELSKDLGITASDIVRRALDDYFDKMEERERRKQQRE